MRCCCTAACLPRASSDYDRCNYVYCGGPNCSHLHDHKVLIWRSHNLTNRSWTLVGEALGPQPTLGTFYRPHIQYNPSTKRYVLVVNGNGLGHYKYFSSTSASPEGPFTSPQDMNLLYYEQKGSSPIVQMGDFGFFADGLDAYLVVNVMGSGQGIHVEKLNPQWTNGLNDTTKTSGCLSCGLPPQESPSMYKTAAGKYVVLLAGATCFGVPQPDGGQWSGHLPVGPATKRWGGTGVFVYVADAPLGPYTYSGDINNRDNHQAQRSVMTFGEVFADGEEGVSAAGASGKHSDGDDFFCGECGPNKAPNPGKEDYQTLTLECASSTIDVIDFAKFGLPTGECGSYKPGDGCPKSCPPHHCNANAKAWVEHTCVGKTSCTLDPMHALGDTCPNKFKRFVVQARCATGNGTAITKRGAHGPPPPSPPAPSSPSCGVCMGNPCRAGKCVLPIQLNSIVRDHAGAPLALTGGMWALNSDNQVTDILGE